MKKDDLKFRYGCVAGLIFILLYIKLYPSESSGFFHLLLWILGLFIFPTLLTAAVGIGQLISNIHILISNLKNRNSINQKSNIDSYSKANTRFNDKSQIDFNNNYKRTYFSSSSYLDKSELPSFLEKKCWWCNCDLKDDIYNDHFCSEEHSIDYYNNDSTDDDS